MEKMISKTIILLITSLAIILIIYWLKKNKKVKYSKEIINHKGNNDWNKAKVIPALNCLQCQACLLENNGCCANCKVNLSISEETHCQEHNHNHSHYHTPKVPQELIMASIFLVVGVIWIVKKLV